MRIRQVAYFFILFVILLPGAGVAGDYDQDGKLFLEASIRAAFLGDAVAIDGGTAVVVAPGDNDEGGAVHIFERSDSGWQHKAKLTVSDSIRGEPLRSVAISGDTIVVGKATDINDNGVDAGAAYIFVKPQTGWEDMTETAKLLAADGAAKHTFGTSVAIAGTTLVVGASGHENGNVHSGAVYVFEGSGANWTQLAKLTASDGVNGDLLGFSLDLDNDTVVAGAYGKEQKKGAVYVFKKPDSGWVDATEDFLLEASDRAAGDQFGFDVAIDAGHIVIGADGEDTNGIDSGAVYLFSGADWSRQEKIIADDGIADQGFGYAVDVSGNVMVTGALLDDDNGPRSGSVYVYGLSAGVAEYREKLVASDGGAEDRLGSSVAMTDHYILAGAYNSTIDGKTGSGSAYVFGRIGINTPPQAQDDSFETERDVAVTTGSVLANDTDPDGDALSISQVDSDSAQGGRVVDKGNGVFVYTPPSGYTGADSFGYSVSDGRGGEAQATVHITVKAAASENTGGGGGGGGGVLNPWLLLLFAGLYRVAVCGRFLPCRKPARDG